MSGSTMSQSDNQSPERVGKKLAYEGAGPTRLSKTPPKPRKKRASEATGNWGVIRSHAERRINMQRNWRQSWMQHWQLLETYLLPRRGIFINSAMPTPNTMIRGMPINQNILDPTATMAMRRCAAGIMSNEMSPSRQWFKLKPALYGRDEAPSDAIEWFEEVESRMNTVMSRSNFYQEAAQMFEDLVTFGTAPMIIYEDDEDVIRCFTPCCGEYFLSSSSANRAQTMSRTFVMSVSAIVEMFGLENCPRDVQELWREKGGALEQEKVVAHMIEPNMPINMPDAPEGEGVVAGDFAWRETYWIWGQSSEYPLSIAGFHDQPHIVPRWAVTSNDPYGRSIGMDVLPDIMQLQVMVARKAEGVEKMLRPPMLASIDMQNQPSSILPGKITYVQSLSADKGMRPAYTVQPDVKDIGADIAELRMRCKEGFFNDLFAMLENTTKEMTAYEVAGRNQEKLQILGPVIERLQNEALAPSIKRTFKIMERRGILPPLPASLHGVPLGIEYVGVLALAQKATKTAGMERYAQTMQALAQTHPEVSDVWDPDELAREYSEDLFLSRKIMRTPQQVAVIRAARAKQMQQQGQMAAAHQAAQIGKTASDIDVGGGMSAMALMSQGMGGAQPSGV